MSTEAEQRLLVRVIAWTCLLCTISVLPGLAFDSVNLPKLTVLSICAFVILGFMCFNLKSVFRGLKNYPSGLVLLFGINLVFVLLFSGSNIYQAFYGTYGRSTGYLNYLSLLIILIAGIQIRSPLGFHKLSQFLIFAGGASSFYGALQILNLDFIAWKNSYGPVIGFLGNPNFQSSFLAFFGVMLGANLLYANYSRKKGFGFLVLFILNGVVIFKTTSQQGLLILGIGAFFLVFIRIYQTQVKSVFYLLALTGSSGLVLGILGVLNIGPLARWLFGPTVSYRGDYWGAAWRMTLEHPFLGVGFDHYGEWYRRSRSLDATLRRGPEVTSNTAHNVFLDISSNGGFPLLVLYSILMLFVAFAAFVLIKRGISTELDTAVIGLIAVWLAYQIQSIISINQIGLSVWGWAISGMIVGLYLRDHTPQKLNKFGPKKNRSIPTRDEVISPRSVLGVFIGGFLGLLVSVPNLVSSINYHSALTSGDLKRIQVATNAWPPNVAHQLQTAATFRDFSFFEQSKEVTLLLLLRHPDSFKGWETLASLPNSNEQDVKNAKAQMKRLDPLNPELK